MSHPHARLVYGRKQVGLAKKLAWGDPGRLEKIHRALRAKYVTGGKKPEFTQAFKNMDKPYPNTLSKLGFKSIIVNSGVILSPEDADELFRYYDQEGHGSLDANDFLIKIRYELAMDKFEAERIIAELGKKMKRGSRNKQTLEQLFIDTGVRPDGVTERDFVHLMQAFGGDAFSTSAMLFLFSLVSGNDRNAVVHVSAVAELFFTYVVQEEKETIVLDIADIERRIADVIYDRNSSVTGRIGFMRLLARGDHDFNSFINNREFNQRMKSFAPLHEREINYLFDHYADSQGKLYFADLVDNYQLRNNMKVSSTEMQEIVSLAAKSIRYRSSPYRMNEIENARRIFELHDTDASGFLNIYQFVKVMDDMAAGAFKDIELEILYEQWATKGGKFNWEAFLKDMISETWSAVESETVAKNPQKRYDRQYAKELELSMALVLCDPNRQDGGSQGFLRITRIFDRYDINHTGKIGLVEFRRALRGMPTEFPFDDQDIQIVFDTFDTDNSGTISYSEFISAMQHTLHEHNKRQTKPVEDVYSEERLSGVIQTVAVGAYSSKLLGTQGLLSAFGKYDRDGDGYVDKREFFQTLRWVCDPVPSEEDLSQLFDHYARTSDKEGKVNQGVFVRSLNGAQYFKHSEAELKQKFHYLAKSITSFPQKGVGSRDALKEVFEKYDRGQKGGLNLVELTLAMRNLGCHTPNFTFDVECAYRYFTEGEDSDLVSFDQFNALARDKAIVTKGQPVEVLLAQLYYDIYGPGTQYGTMGVIRGLNKLDHGRIGMVEEKEFVKAMNAFGSSMTVAESRHLFRLMDQLDPAHKGAIDIGDFAHRLRMSVSHRPSREEVLPTINKIAESVEFRNVSLGGWTSKFEEQDVARNGTVDLKGFSKAVGIVASNKIGDYETERLFDYYSDDRLTVDYRMLVHDLMHHPLNRGRVLDVPPMSKDIHRQKPVRDLVYEPIIIAPPELIRDRTLVPKLYQAMYLPGRQALGTLKLQTYFGKCLGGTHSDRYMKKREFMLAIDGLVAHDGFLDQLETAALFEQLKQGDRVDVKQLLHDARMGHQVELSDTHYADIISCMHDQMWYSGKRETALIVEIFRSDVRRDGHLDLHDFTACINRVASGLYTNLEIELLFNNFTTDRLSLNVRRFATVITPPGKPDQPVPEGPKASDIQAIIDKLANQIYNPKNVSSGTLALKKVLKKVDRDRDDNLSRKDFLDAMQTLGVTQLVRPAEMHQLFDALSRGEGTNARVSVPEILELLQGAETHTRLSAHEYHVLMYTLLKNLPVALSTGPHAVRVFERYDTRKTQRIDLHDFTAALYIMMNLDTKLTEVQIEAVFNMMDKNRTGTINYVDFLETIASLPSEEQTHVVPSRVVDTTSHRNVPHDVTPRAFQPDYAATEAQPSKFAPTDRMLYVEQNAMANWHNTTGLQPVKAAAGGAPSLLARQSLHPARYGSACWVPPVKGLRSDWQESNRPGISAKANPTSQTFERFCGSGTQSVPLTAPPRFTANLKGASVGDAASDAGSVASALPPYLTEAESIEEWMAMLQLQKYLPLFKANEVDLSTVTELSEQDLSDMGLPIGPRKKVLKAAKLMS